MVRDSVASMLSYLLDETKIEASRETATQLVTTCDLNLNRHAYTKHNLNFECGCSKLF